MTKLTEQEKIINNYAHDYRDIAMSQLVLKGMLMAFTEELNKDFNRYETEQYRGAK
jgi:chromosome condensin MukBEF MukE localization factor